MNPAAASESRKTTAAATSDGSTNRRSGMRRHAVASLGALDHARPMSVFVVPGATALTRTPSRPVGERERRVSDSTAALAAA